MSTTIFVSTCISLSLALNNMSSWKFPLFNHHHKRFYFVIDSGIGRRSPFTSIFQLATFLISSHQPYLLG